MGSVATVALERTYQGGLLDWNERHVHAETATATLGVALPGGWVKATVMARGQGIEAVGFTDEPLDEWREPDVKPWRFRFSTRQMPNEVVKE